MISLQATFGVALGASVMVGVSVAGRDDVGVLLTVETVAVNRLQANKKIKTGTNQ